MIINKTTSISNYQVDILKLAQKNIHLQNYRINNICKYFDIDTTIKDDYILLSKMFEKLKSSVTKEDIVIV